MEPISLVVGALVAGASAALKDTASQAVKDAYQGLRTLVVHYWMKGTEGTDTAKEAEAKVLLDNLEEDPNTYQVPLEKKLTKVMPQVDRDLVEKAQQVYQLLDEAGFSAGKYKVSMGNAQGVQIGDFNTQTNTFNK